MSFVDSKQDPIPFADDSKNEINPTFKEYAMSTIPYTAIGACIFGYSFNFGMGSIIWPKQVEMIVTPGTKELYNGIVGIPSTIINTFVPPLAGFISDKIHTPIGKRLPLILFGYLLAAIFSLVCAFFIFPWRNGSIEISFIFLCIFSCFQWIGLSCGIGSFTGITPDIIPPKRFGTAAGIIGLFRTAGQLISVLIAGFLIQFLPYPYNFMLTYGIMGLVFIFGAVYPFSTIKEPKKVEKKEEKPFVLGDFLCSLFLCPPTKYFNFYCVFWSRFFYEMGVYGVVNYIQYFLGDVFNDPRAVLSSSLLIASVLIIGMIISPIAGLISDYISRKLIVLVSCAFTAIIIIAILLITLFSGPLWLVYITTSLLGVGIGIFYAVDWALIIDAIPNKEDTAKDMGLWHISDTVPSMVAPLITGLILNGLKPAVGTRYAWVIVYTIATFWFALSAIAIIPFYVKPKNNDPNETIHILEKKELQELEIKSY